MLEHLVEGGLPEIEQGDERELLGVGLFREIGRRIEGREQGIGLRERVADEVVPATEVPPHLVEVAANLLEGGLEAVEQSPEILVGRGEVLVAEPLERVVVAIPFEPSFGALRDAGVGPVPGGLAVFGDERGDDAVDVDPIGGGGHRRMVVDPAAAPWMG